MEVVLPRGISKELGVEKKGKCELGLFGKKRLADLGEVDVCVRNPESGEERKGRLDCAILSDKEIDCVILGTEAQAKLRVIPDTVTGKPIFK